MSDYPREIEGTYTARETYFAGDEMAPPPESYANGFGRAWAAALRRAEDTLPEGTYRFRVEHHVAVTKTNPLSVDEYRIVLIPD